MSISIDGQAGNLTDKELAEGWRLNNPLAPTPIEWRPGTMVQVGWFGKHGSLNRLQPLFATANGTTLTLGSYDVYRIFDVRTGD